jgi:hypothetical protein
MQRSCQFALIGLLGVSLVAGCSGGGGNFSGGVGGGTTAPVSLTITDTPLANVSVQAFQVVVVSVVANPGNVLLVSSPVTVEVRRLEEETAFLTNTNVPTGTYTSLTVMFANPSLTFHNGTAQTIAGCVPGAVCNITPTTTTLTATASFPSPGLTLTSNSPVGLQLDVNLNSVLTSSMDLDFNAGVSVSQLASGQPGGVLVPVEDVVGQVTSTDSVNNRFNLQTPVGTFVIQVNSSTAFLNFPGSVCSSAGSACVKAGQIVAVDLSLLAGGTLLAKNVFFEDSDTSKAEVEGVIVSVNRATQQFTMVALQETPSVAEIPVGAVVTVNVSVSTTLDIDNRGPDTSAFTFQSVNDLLVGQEVQVRRLSSSSGTTINADRVRLESSRFTGTIASVNAPSFNVSGLPSLFASASPTITQIQAQTSAFTEFAGNASNFSQLAVTNMVSLRGQLFGSAGSPVLVATKVIKR